MIKSSEEFYKSIKEFEDVYNRLFKTIEFPFSIAEKSFLDTAYDAYEALARVNSHVKKDDK